MPDTPTQDHHPEGHKVAANQLNRSAKQLLLSRDLTREFFKSTNMQQLMGLIFNRVIIALDAMAGSLWMVDWRSQQNVCHVAEGPAKEQIIGMRLPKGKGIVGKVIESCLPEVVFDCANDPNFTADVDNQSGFITHSMICVPLVIDDHAYGAIQVINKKQGIDGHFDINDRNLVEDLAISAAIAIKNARLLESESRIKEMHTLMTLSRQIVSTLDINQVLDTVTNTANELVAITGAAVALWHETKNQLFLAVLSDDRAISSDNSNQQQLLKLLEQVRSSARSHYIANKEDLRKQTKNLDNPWLKYVDQNNLISIWATPLQDEEGVLGVLWLESNAPHFASNNRTDLLVILASQTTVALRNASLFSHIPFAHLLGKVGKKGRHWFSSRWQKLLLAVLLLILSIGLLEYLPFFRFVTGNCVVEARLGQGVFLQVGGRIEHVFVHEGQVIRGSEALVQLDETPIRLLLVEAESKLAILERQIVEAKAASQLGAMSRAAIERVAARAQVVRARADLQRTTVTAPGNGVILTRRPEELQGRDFPIGAEILRFADPANFTVVVAIPEEDLVAIEIGQNVRGILLSQPGKGFRGKVRHVGRAYPIPTEALYKGSESTAEPEGFVVELDVTETDVPLRPGMTGKAMIHTPQTSVVLRWWRRIVNFKEFWFGA